MKIVMALILFCRMQATAQDMQSCPMHKQHQAEVEKHGDACGTAIASELSTLRTQEEEVSCGDDDAAILQKKDSQF
jgi:hypothetical protein